MVVLYKLRTRLDILDHVDQITRRVIYDGMALAELLVAQWKDRPDARFFYETTVLGRRIVDFEVQNDATGVEAEAVRHCGMIVSEQGQLEAFGPCIMSKTDVPVGRKRRGKAEQTRSNILRSAGQMCADTGYDHLSLEDVAAAASVTRGAVYHHFGSKKGLFLEIVRSELHAMGARVLSAAAGAPTLWEALVAGCRVFLRESQQRRYQQVILTDAPAVLGIATWNKLDYSYTTRSLVEILQELRDGHTITISDPVATAEALSDAMNQLSRWVAAGGSEEIAFETLLMLLESLRQ